MDIRCCNNCFHNTHNRYGEPCFGCNDNSKWEAQTWLKLWLNSFDTSSATKCFEAVNLLKQRLEGEE